MTKIIDISLFLLIAGFVTATSRLDFDPESEAKLFANHTEAWAATHCFRSLALPTRCVAVK